MVKTSSPIEKQIQEISNEQNKKKRLKSPGTKQMGASDDETETDEDEDTEMPRRGTRPARCILSPFIEVPRTKAGTFTETEDALYLELLNTHGKPVKANKQAVEAFLEVFPERTQKSITSHISAFNLMTTNNDNHQGIQFAFKFPKDLTTLEQEVCVPAVAMQIRADF